MNSGTTAIARKTVSAPTRWLCENHYVYGDVLHFGEGKAYQDTAALEALPNINEVYAYDPNSVDEWKRTLPIGCRFGFTVCNYVLNTLMPMEREQAFIDAFLKSVYAIFTVRISKVEGQPWADGVITSRGTFQTQLSAEEWIIWFYDTMQTRLVGNYRVKILNKTRNYLMVEVS